MRLLAIVSTLTLIPVVAGGLLGMNLGDSPWPVTLGQVAFGTLMLMLGVLYTFMAKGWLR
jgi:Mg2+ and Co2+ transporter CorA